MHTIIILSHQIPTRLRYCLESIEKAYIPGGFEVIVVNDGGPEEIKNIAEKFKGNMDITYIRNSENMGVSYSRNAGIKVSSGEYITIFADNYIVERDHFIRKSEYLNDYDVVSSNIITVGKGIVAKALNQYYQYVINNWIVNAQKTENGYTGHGFPAGAATSFKADVIRATGLFDETLVSGEDSDYNLRMDEKGMKRLHVPDLIVIRKEDISFWQTLKKQYQSGVDMFFYRERNKYDHMVKYEALHACQVVLSYLKTTRNIRYFPLVTLIHWSYRVGIIINILKKRWREKKIF